MDLLLLEQPELLEPENDIQKILFPPFTQKFDEQKLNVDACEHDDSQ